MSAFGCGARAYAWSYQGLTVVSLENEVLRVSVLPEKGSDVVELRHKPSDVNVLLTVPRGWETLLRAPPSSPLTAFYATYVGGWQDVLPSAGEASFRFRGAEWGTNYETPLLPWRYRVSQAAGEASVKLVTELVRYPFRVEKVLRLRDGSDTLVVEERITNLSDEDLEYMWLQHIVFADSLVREGCRVDIAAGTVLTHGPPEFSELSFLKPGTLSEWPYSVSRSGERVDLSVVPKFSGRVYDMAYVMDLSEGRFAVSSPERGVSVEVEFPREVFRYVWLLYLNGGPCQPPWHGRVRALGVMPCTSYPARGLLRAIENETAVVLRGGASVSAELRVRVSSGAET